jgi:type II restriction/modification system DNA methylase subunit YeeA
MNKSKLKSYAPQARKDFIAAVTARANLLGLSEAGGILEVAPGERKGDIAIIAGREWPVKLYEQRERLIKHMNTVGFSQAVEAVAYTWFNRFAALRYMEIHDYLDHGHRVLSNREGGMPEILNHATELDLPGLNKDKAIELKLAGNKDGDLYKMLLVAQCNALSNAMPFLFEHIDDETELLLPDNLLRTDSIIAKLVEAIPEEDWQEVEIIGWLYQFYISEKKDEVIGKVVKSENIPAATQLFTPNWIVQYLVQNSVGRLWLMANPASTLKSQWPYFIEPAEQTPEVQAQLDALIQTRMSEDGGSLNPETITMLDPACGSGHILVVGYDVLKAIYLERGYQLRAIPRLILEKNLYGLDIDDRAAQMAGFALLMKARADDRSLFDNPPKLNVLALQESKGLNADEIVHSLQSSIAGGVSPQGVTRQTRAEFADNDLFPNSRPQMNLGESMAAESVEAQSIRLLIDTFAQAKTFGSLIQIPPKLNAQLATLADLLRQIIQNGDLYAKAAAQDVLPLVEQAMVLGMQFDAVVANPPYMGGKGMNDKVKDFAKKHFPDSKSDLFAMFIERGFGWCKPSGFNSMVTMQSWMFLSSFERMREMLLKERTLSCMVHMGNGVMGIAFGTAASVFWNVHLDGYKGCFSYCGNDDVGDDGKPDSFPIHNERLKVARPDDFKKIPGSPIAYWVSDRTRDVFCSGVNIGDIGQPRMGMATGNNDLHMRYWHEVCNAKLGLNYPTRLAAVESKRKWFPYNKGGSFRRWYGNNEYVVNWEKDGQLLQTMLHSSGRVWAHNFNLDFIFQECITWTATSASYFGVRYSPQGFLFDYNGSSLFLDEKNIKYVLGLMASNLSYYFINILNPTVANQAGDIGAIPVIHDDDAIVGEIEKNVENAIKLSKYDWDSFEFSWNFLRSPLLVDSRECRLLSFSWSAYEKYLDVNFCKLKNLEEENNRLFIEAYGLEDELSPDVPEDQITLARADREKDCQRLISYAIGCMMGRYSLDEPGLIYAHAGNIGFDATRYPTFPADTDGIVPLTEELWYEDDAANRIREFLRSVWGAETLEENLAWLAESLGKNGNETPDETIRRYLSGTFFKDHLQTYKKRPIYWLFSSGKQGAFQALVYLHRYHEGTLARMRSEYVVPLTGKIQSRIEMLTKDAEAATSTAARNKLNKEIEGLRKKHVELLSYDEKLRHYADMRIQLDLDDGVKVNYSKFGDLLAEVKAVTGGVEE